MSKRGIYWADAPKNLPLPEKDADGHLWKVTGESSWMCVLCGRPAMGAVFIVLGGEPGKIPTCEPGRNG